MSESLPPGTTHASGEGSASIEFANPKPIPGTIHIKLRQAQIRIEGGADPGLVRLLLGCWSASRDDCTARQDANLDCGRRDRLAAGLHWAERVSADQVGAESVPLAFPLDCGAKLTVNAVL